MSQQPAGADMPPGDQPTRRRDRRAAAERRLALLPALIVAAMVATLAVGLWWVRSDGSSEQAVGGSKAPGSYVPPSAIAPSSATEVDPTPSRSGTPRASTTRSSSPRSGSLAPSSTSGAAAGSSSAADEAGEQASGSQTPAPADEQQGAGASTGGRSSSSGPASASTSDPGGAGPAGPARSGSAGSPEAPSGDPVRVEVVSGGRSVVDASLRPTFLDSENVLAPPFGTAGWYAEAGWPRPGYRGASILVGHINHQGEPDVFWNLPMVTPGDRISVRYSSGETVRFEVTRSEAQPKTAVPKDETIWDHDNPRPVLRLITCDPTTPLRSGHYEGNWVVWADPVG